VISIIIPAHNEASAIRRTLTALTQGAQPGDLDIVVVCNGCTDNTAQLARDLESSVRVIETDIASKVNALNIGDKVAGCVFPRIYIDADIEVPLRTVRGLAERLAVGDVLAVAPRARIDSSVCSRAVRWFFDIAALLPSAKEGIGGSGVYALSRAGRGRFGEFPDVIADDAYVRIQFRAQECETVQTLTTTIIPPRRLRELIQVRSRVRHGHLEVFQSFPNLWRQHWQSNLWQALYLMRRLPLWPKLALYAYVIIIARIRAYYRLFSNTRVWDRITHF
jgi:cellulose synthase/poly-beta-1,6-N-acetylglucosamine synthase-like glycosyltransferase